MASLCKTQSRLLILLLLCCISHLFVAAAGPSKLPPPKGPNRSVPGGSGQWPPPNNPLDRIGGRRPRPPPPPVVPQAPLPAWKAGDVIGCRAKYYEVNSKVTTMHPGIIVAGPDPNGNFRVAMISNKLLGNGPRQLASKYVGGVEGEISLGTPTVIHGQYLRPWKRPGLGGTPPLQPATLVQLKKDINTATNGFARLRRRDLATTALLRGRLARRTTRGTR